MHTRNISMSAAHRQTRYQRVMMFFVLLFLALQLIGANAHGHAYTDHEPDCAACALQDMPAGDMPPLALTVEPLPLPGSLPVLAPAGVVRVAQTGYLTPPSHAPPGVAVSSN